MATLLLLHQHYVSAAAPASPATNHQRLSAAAFGLAGTLLPGIRTRATRSGLQPRMSEAPGPAYPWPQFQQEAGGALTGLCGKMAKPFAR